MTIQERRYQETLAKIERVASKREDAIKALIKAETQLAELRRQARRYEKRRPTLEIEAAPQPAKQAAPAPAPAPAPKAERTKENDGLDIPDFLRAGSTGMTAADKAAIAEIEQAKAAQRAAKSRGRVATMKAKRSGELRRMPLEGRAALEAIQRGAR